MGSGKWENSTKTGIAIAWMVVAACSNEWHFCFENAIRSLIFFVEIA
jgi:hypothetical protein